MPKKLFFILLLNLSFINLNFALQLGGDTISSNKTILVNSPVGELELNLSLVDFRNQVSGRFEVLILENGKTTELEVGEARTYVGTVKNQNNAFVTGYLSRDGSFKSVVTIGRGVQWWFKDDSLVRIKGDLSYDDVSYNYPEAMTLAKNMIGSKIYEFGVAYDIDVTAYNEIITKSSSVINGLIEPTLAVFESAEMTAALLGTTYLHNLKLRPNITRILIRKDAINSPYGTPQSNGYYSSNNLSELKSHWETYYSDVLDYTHHVTLVNLNKTGGVAYAPGRYTTTNFGRENEFFTSYVILRHEMGHTFWIGDYDGGYRDPEDPDNLIALPPEGKTIMNGNRYAIFTGSAIMDARLQLLKDLPSGRFTEYKNLRTEYPPMATLDIETCVSNNTYRVDVLSNDYDTNSDSISLIEVDSLSINGVPLKIVNLENGKKGIEYKASDKNNDFDRFTYLIEDANGSRGIGNVYIKVINTIPWVFSHTNLDYLVKGRSRSYETKPEVSNTKFYKDDGYMIWDIESSNNGEFTFSIEYASTRGGQKMELSVNEEKVGIITTQTTSSSDNQSSLIFNESDTFKTLMKKGVNKIKLSGIPEGQGVGGNTMIRSLKISPENLQNSVDEPNKHLINYYPNPLNNTLHVNNYFEKGKILDLTGRTVKEFTESSVDVSNLPKGLYILRLLNYSNHTVKSTYIVKGG